MNTTIDGVEFAIEVQEPRKVSPRKKSLWFTATWECKLCGAKGDVSEFEKQNTYGGVSNAATGRARRHVEEKHKDSA